MKTQCSVTHTSSGAGQHAEPSEQQKEMRPLQKEDGITRIH